MSNNIEYNYISSTNTSLVNKILEQGQRLRNSMVQTIVNYDPFNREILSSVSLKSDENSFKDNNQKCSSTDRSNKVKNVIKDRCQTLYDYKCKNGLDIIEEYSLKSEDSILKPLKSKFNSCFCDICLEYNKISHQNVIETVPEHPELKLHIPEKNTPEKSTNSAEMVTKNSIHNNQILKFVDSLKMSINFLKLNSAGKRKIVANTDRYTSDKVTYFLEYKLPEILSRNLHKTTAKVNTGLSRNKICFTSKKTNQPNKGILLKHEEVHLVSNLDLLDLNSINIEIRINYRTLKQKMAVFFGKANFNLGVILSSPTLSVEQNLCVFNGRVPVILGHLNICLQLGCDKLHFGKEFIDAVSFQKSNINLSNVSVFKELETDYSAIYNLQKPITYRSELHPNTEKSSYFDSHRAADSLRSKEKELKENQVPDQLLYCFINIPEAQLLTEAKNTYLVCYGIHRDDIITSRIVYDTHNPGYNFYKLIPLLYDITFLGKLQDKNIIIEIWEKGSESEQIIGITRLPLHRFYVIFRNPQIATLLFKNQNPTIGIDWFEPITHPVTKKTCGQLKALLAIGTEAQINLLRQNIELKLLISQNTEKTFSSLKSARSEQQNILKSKDIHQNQEPEIDSNKNIENNTVVYDKYVQAPEVELQSSSSILVPVQTISLDPWKNRKVDVSTQIEMDKMDSENLKCDKNNALNNFVNDNILVNNETQNQKDVYENCTNENVNSNIKSTTDLLDTLQKALSPSTTSILQSSTSIDKRNEVQSEKIEGFKAHIIIDSALHLPSRKKCKSKKNKAKNHSKNNENEILPSTYVTFKTDHSSDIVVTQVVPKISNPKWDYRCDSVLPADLLLNNTKRLIFKVWRRANATTLQPNFQTDVVLGFAALDLTVLLSGLPNVQGWFNIVDFSSKCNGQIKIHVIPLENLQKYNKYKNVYSPEKPKLLSTNHEHNENDGSPPELFNRALKRKFTELEEITQRLKQRLSKITNEDSDVSDEFADEFEKDLNTECIETEKVSFENLMSQPPEDSGTTSRRGRTDNENEENDSEMNEKDNLPSFDELFSSLTRKIPETSDKQNNEIFRLENPEINKNQTQKSLNQQNKSSFDEILKNMTQKLTQNQNLGNFSENFELIKNSPFDEFLQNIAQKVSQNQNFGTSTQNCDSEDAINCENQIFTNITSSSKNPLEKIFEQKTHKVGAKNRNSSPPSHTSSSKTKICPNLPQNSIPVQDITSLSQNSVASFSNRKNDNEVEMNQRSSFDEILKNMAQKLNPDPNLGCTSSTSQKFGQHLSQERSKIDTLLEKINTLTSSPEQKIDSLLEKLTIESEKSFSNRYVSGCSLNQEITSESPNNQFLQSLGSSTDQIFNPMLFQKIFSEENSPKNTDELLRNVHSLKSLVSSNSSTSVETFSDSSNTPRQAPEGGSNDK